MEKKWLTTMISSESTHCRSFEFLHDLALLSFFLGFHLVLSPAMPVKIVSESIYLPIYLYSLSLQALIQQVPIRRVRERHPHLGTGRWVLLLFSWWICSVTRGAPGSFRNKAEPLCPLWVSLRGPPTRAGPSGEVSFRRGQARCWPWCFDWHLPKWVARDQGKDAMRFCIGD